MLAMDDRPVKSNIFIIQILKDFPEYFIFYVAGPII